MAKGFNKVTVMGNLTRDPELRTTPNRSKCLFIFTSRKQKLEEFQRRNSRSG